MSRVVADMVRTSFPAIRRAARMAQRLKCARYSSSVIPPLPTSSMSGSFHPPGPAARACWAVTSRLASIEGHLSEMSPVVRHRCPMLGAHSHGWLEPHSRSEGHTSELQSPCNLVCRLLLEKKKH